MTNREAIKILKIERNHMIPTLLPGRIEAMDMAISALQAQEVKQEVKKSRCTYKPDCPWYDGSKCNSPNDHGCHECDYDRGIFPESYEENVKNSTESSLTQKGLDTISRQSAIDAMCAVCGNDCNKSEFVYNATQDEQVILCPEHYVLTQLPSAQPEYYDYSDIEPLWKSFAEENDINLTETAKQLKDAMWCGYRKGKADAQSEPYKEKLNEIASALSEKFAYMNTCLNERDIILGYLGVKRSCETHCYTDCTNTKCESHPSSTQPDPVVDADKLKRCRFEYINACKTVTYPTPDTSKNDIYDANAVIKALHPIFGDEEF